MVNKRLAVALTVLACLLSGCRTIRELQLQKITEVKIAEVNSRHIEMDLAVELLNTRSFTGRIHDLLCDVALTGHTIGQGHQPDSIELPSHSASVVRVPFTINSEDVTVEDFEAVFDPEIPYTIRGTAAAEKPFKMATVKLDVHGKFKAPDVIPVDLSTHSASDLVTFSGLTIKEVGLMESTGVLQLSIRNPFRFPMTLRGFEYVSLSGGSKVADGSLDHDLVLEPGLNKVDLPVRMHLAGIAGGILSGMSQLRLPDIHVTGLATMREKGRSLQIQFGVDSQGE